MATDLGEAIGFGHSIQRQLDHHRAGGIAVGVRAGDPHRHRHLNPHGRRHRIKQSTQRPRCGAQQHVGHAHAVRTGDIPQLRERHRERAEPYAVAAWQQMMVAAVGRQLGETDHGAHRAAHEPWAIPGRQRGTGAWFQQRTVCARICKPSPTAW